MVTSLQNVYNYRELIRNLTMRDLKVRYRNSIFGFLWMWGNPILMTLVFTLVFKVLGQNKIPHYPLFIMIGWLTWGFTNASVQEGLGSVVFNSNLVKKVWFPRETLPISAVLGNAINFLFALPLIFALMLYYRIEFQPMLLIYFPIIFASQFTLLTGIALFLSASNVYYRDTGVVTGLLTTAWFFLTPVFYTVPQFAQSYTASRLFYIANPMASIIEGYRSLFYGGPNGAPPGPPDLGFLVRTLATGVVILILGYIFFSRSSRKFGETL